MQRATTLERLYRGLRNACLGALLALPTHADASGACAGSPSAGNVGTAPMIFRLAQGAA